MVSSSDVTRASLLSRAKIQDPQAWNELVDLYGPLISYWGRRCGLDAAQAGDIVQEVFASVAKAISRYEAKRDSGAFRAWLWTITANKVRDYFRREDSLLAATGGSTALGELHAIPDPATIPDQEPTESEQISALLQRAMEQVQGEFESRTWEIFQRSVVDQIPSHVVAQEFQISAAAIRQTKSRVLRRLRQQLGDLEES